MDASAKRLLLTNSLSAFLQAEVLRALDLPLRADESVPFPDKRTVIVVAYSGGPDSTALLDICMGLRRSKPHVALDVHAVHVHHALLPQAGQWLQHCATFCALNAIPFHAEYVVVNARNAITGARSGVEAAARDARYNALLVRAKTLNASMVLTAHHADDRIETFLLSWVRGAGIYGLKGPASRRLMRSKVTETGSLLGSARDDSEHVKLVRPWLNVPRARISTYIATACLEAVVDPTNENGSNARSIVRTQVLPALQRLRPGFLKSCGRTMDLLAEAAETLEEVAAADFSSCSSESEPAAVHTGRLGELSPARQAMVIRRWLAIHGVLAPSRQRLLDLVGQAVSARPDTQLNVRFGELEARWHRQWLVLIPRSSPAPGRSQLFFWKGEYEISLPLWRGCLRFVPTTSEAGFAAHWLRVVPLRATDRVGGERLKLHPLRPSRSLKSHFQSAAIPAYTRLNLPLLWRGDKLIFTAGLGADARFLASEGLRITVLWHADGPES